MRGTATPARAQRLRELPVQPTQVRPVDRLVDRLGHHMPAAVIGKRSARSRADLLRAPPQLQPSGHERPQHRVSDKSSRSGPTPPSRRQPLSSERPVRPARLLHVAAQLPADRRRVTPQLLSDRPHPKPLPPQIGNPDPFILRQIPRGDLPLPRTDHRRIVQLAPVADRDRPPVSPPLARPPVDPHDPARLGATHPLRDQPSELLPLHRLRCRAPPTTSHRNSPTSGVATMAGIRR